MAHLNGQADLCDLTVKLVDFKDKFKVLQLVHGLVDKDIQQKVLAKGAELPEGEKLSLAEVGKFVEAMEMGKTARALVSEVSGGLHRLSDHQQGKQSARQDRRTNTKSGKKESCQFCGKEKHE